MTTLKDLTKSKGVIGASVNKKEKGFVAHRKGFTMNADVEVLKGEEYFLIYEKKNVKTKKFTL